MDYRYLVPEFDKTFSTAAEEGQRKGRAPSNAVYWGPSFSLVRRQWWFCRAWSNPYLTCVPWLMPRSQTVLYCRDEASPAKQDKEMKRRCKQIEKPTTDNLPQQHLSPRTINLLSAYDVDLRVVWLQGDCSNPWKWKFREGAIFLQTPEPALPSCKGAAISSATTESWLWGLFIWSTKISLKNMNACLNVKYCIL